jgi:hypothetical protein
MWYYKVTDDINQVVGAIAHFEDQLADARKEIPIKGSLERASAGLPGITEYRFNQLQEVESILENLNIRLRKKRSEVFRKYLENYNRQLSSRDAEKYVDGDSDVVSLTEVVNQFALVRNQYLGIMKGLESKSFQLNNIVKLRTVGIENVSID